MKFPAVLGLLGITALPLLPQKTTTIEGLVVDTITALGISGANVQLTLHQGPVEVYVRDVVTNELGSFRVLVLTPGDYTARAHKQGYSGVGTVQFHINADGTSIRPRLELIPPATLRGRVLGSEGKSARAAVELGPRFNITVNTDDDGYFTFQELTPGTYTLLARPKTAELASTQETFRSEVMPTYYPSALERTQAELITVRGGAGLSGYEIRLQSAPVYRVSGVVLDTNGKPAPEALVQLLDRVADGFSSFSGNKQVFSIRSSSFADTPNVTQSTTTGDDGMFEFPSVRPGDWTIHVESDSVRDDIQQRDVVTFGSAMISLGHRDLDEVQIRLVTPFDLPGIVEGGDASPAIVRAVAVALNGESGYFGGTAHPDVKGALRFEGVIPGSYLISAQSDGDYYALVLMGSSDVTGQIVELAASSPVIRVVLKRGGTIRWALEASKSWILVLVPQSLTGIGYYSFQGGPGMNAELTGIPPGAYYAIALDPLNPRTMADASRLRELIPSATSVRVEEGSVSSLELKINHASD